MLLILLRPDDENEEKTDKAGEVGGEYEDVRLKKSDKVGDAVNWFLGELSALGDCEDAMVSQLSDS